MLMRLKGGVFRGNKKKNKKHKKTLWHQKSQKEHRAPSNSSSLKVGANCCLVVSLVVNFG